MSQEQDHAQQLMYEMQMLEGHLAELQKRESSLAAVLREAVDTIESIKSIKDEKSVKSLVPLGLGAFAKTEMSAKEKLIVNIGAGIAVEKDHDSAINYVESRIKEFEVAIQDTAARKQEAAERMDEGREMISQMSQAATKQPAAKKNV